MPEFFQTQGHEVLTILYAKNQADLYFYKESAVSAWSEVSRPPTSRSVKRAKSCQAATSPGATQEAFSANHKPPVLLWVLKV